MDGQRIAINWSSVQFKAYLLSPSGDVLDHYADEQGVTLIERDAMAALGDMVREKWPEAGLAIATGMIGSPLGWAEAPYCPCPAGIADLAQAVVPTQIGALECHIVPGLSATAPDGHGDIMRGEELTLFGIVAGDERFATGRHLIGLPGVHPKYVLVEEGRIESFYTTMSGEIFDRLSERGLLSKLIEGSGAIDDAFTAGFERGLAGNGGLARLLFGVRASVMLGQMAGSDAASNARGLLIGAELADATAQFGDLGAFDTITLCGKDAFCQLYKSALAKLGHEATIADSEKAQMSGFHDLLEALAGR